MKVKFLFIFILMFLFFIWMFIIFSACSVSRALNQPEKKNMSVLTIGTHRDVVLAELGQPVASGSTENGSYDIFSFVQGYDKGNKVSRAFIHGVLDVASFGLWEIAANPIEGIASGKKTRIKITYQEEKVLRVEEIKIPDPPKTKK